MVAFLIFSDWFDPGDAVVRRTDGTEIRGVVRQEMREEVMIQFQESGSGLRAGDRLVLRKSEVREIVQVGNGVLEIFRIRWDLAGLMGLGARPSIRSRRRPGGGGRSASLLLGPMLPVFSARRASHLAHRRSRRLGPEYSEGLLAVVCMTWGWVGRDEIRAWMGNTWSFTKLLVPMLFGGVFVVGFLSALLRGDRIALLVGDDALRANLIGSVVGALFCFATLTEVPITQALIERGMAEGPALALLLAGPALSLPYMLVLDKVMCVRKTLAFCALIVAAATLSGVI